MGSRFFKLYNKISELPNLSKPSRKLIADMIYILHGTACGEKILGPFNIYYYIEYGFCNRYYMLSFEQLDILEKNITFYVITYTGCLEMTKTTEGIYKYVLSYENDEWTTSLAEYIPKKLNWEMINSVDKVVELYKSKTNIIFPPTDTDINYAMELYNFKKYYNMQRDELSQ